MAIDYRIFSTNSNMVTDKGWSDNGTAKVLALSAGEKIVCPFGGTVTVNPALNDGSLVSGYVSVQNGTKKLEFFYVQPASISVQNGATIQAGAEIGIPDPARNYFMMRGSENGVVVSQTNLETFINTLAADYIASLSNQMNMALPAGQQFNANANTGAYTGEGGGFDFADALMGTLVIRGVLGYFGIF